MAVNCVLRRCTVCYGRVLCGRAVYCMIGAVYCMLGWCTVCVGGVLYVRPVYCMLGQFTVC